MNVKKVNYWFQFIATRSKHFGRLQVPKTLHLHPSMTKRQVQRSENTCKDVSPDRPRCPPSIEARNCTIRHKNLRVTLIVWGIRRFDLGVAQGLMGQWKTMHSFPKNSPHLWLKNCSQLQCTSFNLCNITWACDCNRLVVVQLCGSKALRLKKIQRNKNQKSSQPVEWPVFKQQ